MMGKLLVRGMIAGLIAGLVAYGVSKAVGEPQVDKAIAYEEQVNRSMGNMAEPELVSRETQAGTGLLTGVVIYSVAMGGLFSLAFAFAYQRGNRLEPRALSALIGVAAFVAVIAVPALKYPPSPPAASDPATIGLRTAMYFAMLATSVFGMIVATTAATRLRPRLGLARTFLVAGGGYAASMLVVQWALPSAGEVPSGFPADTLTSFRVAAMEIQLAVWITIAACFGYFANALVSAGQRGSALPRP